MMPSKWLIQGIAGSHSKDPKCAFWDGLLWRMRVAKIDMLSIGSRPFWLKAILAQGHFGSRVVSEILHATSGWLKTPSSFVGLLASDDGMGPSSSQAADERTSGDDGEGWGEDAWEVGSPAQTASPHPRLKARPRGVELYLWVLQCCSSLCALLLQKSQGGKSEPRRPESPQTLRQQIKAAIEEPVKEALDAALKKVQDAKCEG